MCTVCSRLWLTILSFVLIGAGLAPAFIPSYADLLNIARLVKQMLLPGSSITSLRCCYCVCVCVCVCVECRSQHPDENSEVITGVVSGLTSATLSLGSAIIYTAL